MTTARAVLLVVALNGLAGCASNALQGEAPAQAGSRLDQCRADVARLQGQLDAEVAERQKLVRAAARREEVLRKQLEAMKSIERAILERDDRLQSDLR